MKKPFYWVKTAICKITKEPCGEAVNIPLGIKGMSPDCPHCSIYKESEEDRRKAIIRQAFAGDWTNLCPRCANKEEGQ